MAFFGLQQQQKDSKQWIWSSTDKNLRSQLSSLNNGNVVCSKIDIKFVRASSQAMARNLNDDNYYALKKMEHFEDKNEMGFPITTIREIKILQGLSHPNILNIKQVVHEKMKNQPPVIYLCLDLMECDILELIKNPSFKITPFKIQEILRQMLTGLQYLHRNQICHRDIKPSNILINGYDNLKIADFGLAKKMKKLSTTKVVTLWYRAPELLLGVRSYSSKVDIWSVGCLAAELLLRCPLLQQCNSESQVLKKIFELAGTPDRCEWQQQLLQQGKNYEQMKPEFSGESTIISYLKQKQIVTEDELLDLIEKMLRLNHHSRLSAGECLAHNFFNMNYPYQRIMTEEMLEQRKLEKEGENGRKKVKV